MKLPTAFQPMKYDYFQLNGGLDLITPTLSLPSGFLRDCLNYEVAITGGYTRISGYERFDGRTSPSTATYGAYSVSFVSPPSLGQQIVGQTSGASGNVALTGIGLLVLTKISGTFVAGETLKVGVTTVATITSSLYANVTPKEDAQYLSAAADYYRGLIGKVPGSGPIRGAVMFNGTAYAFRDNAGGTQTLMYKSSSSGWTQVQLGYEMSFNTGVGQINDGDTVVGGTSGATAVVTRAVLQSGAWGSTAAGRMIFASVTGTFQNGEALKVGGTTKATCAGAQTAITLATGGHFQFEKANFAGSAGTIRLYGCDGANRAWEFDGSVFVPIATGMANDKPTYLVAHKNYLFLSFGASLQYSSLGLPYQWQIITGAGELAVGDNIVGLSVLPGSQSTAALVIYTANNTSILYGTSNSNWNLVAYNNGVGGINYTAQVLSSAYVLDQRGAMSLQTTLNYGNFDAAALTHNIRPIIVDKRTKVVGSSVAREKAQYRLFFNDGYALYLTIVNDQYKGAGLVWYPDLMFNSWSGEKADGSEITLLCSASSGYVYQLDVGTSFDGASIPATLTTSFSTSGGPRILKRYRKCAAEIQSNGYAEIDFAFSVGYGSSDFDQPTPVNYALPFTPAYWDNFTWDQFYFDGTSLAPAECELDGTAENIALTFASNANYMQPYTINSAIVHYTPRRSIR